jgi:phosphoenolpyruvate carboxykinase (GTP)
MPAYEDIDWNGLEYSKERYQELMSVDRESWIKELLSHEELFVQMYYRLPREFTLLRELLLANLWRSLSRWRLPS